MACAHGFATAGVPEDTAKTAEWERDKATSTLEGLTDLGVERMQVVQTPRRGSSTPTARRG